MRHMCTCHSHYSTGGATHRLVTLPLGSHCTPVQLQGDAIPAVQPMKFWPAVADAQFVIADRNANRMPAATYAAFPVAEQHTRSACHASASVVCIAAEEYQRNVLLWDGLTVCARILAGDGGDPCGCKEAARQQQANPAEGPR